MSKFLKALEQAERERALAGPAAAPPSEPEAAPLEAAPDVEAELLPEVIDQDELESHLVSFLAPTSFAAEQYRALRHTVEEQPSLHRIAVTSPHTGDGKTTTAVNLAGALAQSAAARVLVIDADLRRAEVARFVGLADGHRTRGLVDLLVDGRLALDDAVVSLPVCHLDILPAGRPPDNPYELLKSPRLEWVLRQARECYDYVLIDTPPVVPLPDLRLISPWMEGIVLVVCASRTPRRLLRDALDTLDRDKLIGIVFNADDRSAHRYYGEYSKNEDAAGDVEPVGRVQRALRRVLRPWR